VSCSSKSQVFSLWGNKTVVKFRSNNINYISRKIWTQELCDLTLSWRTVCGFVRLNLRCFRCEEMTKTGSIVAGTTKLHFGNYVFSLKFNWRTVGVTNEQFIRLNLRCFAVRKWHETVVQFSLEQHQLNLKLWSFVERRIRTQELYLSWRTVWCFVCLNLSIFVWGNDENDGQYSLSNNTTKLSEIPFFSLKFKRKIWTQELCDLTLSCRTVVSCNNNNFTFRILLCEAQT